jgi:predicted DNA-binding transcriptional regulator AlpA
MNEKKSKSKVIAFAPEFVSQSLIHSVAGISHTTALELEKKGEFPKRRKIPGKKRTGWYLGDVRKWVAGLPFVGDANDTRAAN